MKPATGIKKILKQIFLDNIGLKIMSLFIGFSAWFFISSEHTIEKNIVVPVEIVNKPAFLEIANDYTKSVIVQIQSRQDTRETLYKASIDLQDAREGENVILLQPQNFDAPSSIEILSIRPSTLSIILEPLVNKTIPVLVKYSGVVAENYRVSGTRSSPENVFISGPLSQVSSIDEIFTQVLDISNGNQTIEKKVHLIMENPFINIKFKDLVLAVVQIEEKTVRRTFREVPLTVINLNTDYRLRRKTATVQLSIVHSKKDILKPEDMELFVDGNECEMTLDQQEVPLRFRIITPTLEHGVRVERIVPETVRFRILKLPEKIEDNETDARPQSPVPNDGT